MSGWGCARVSRSEGGQRDRRNERADWADQANAWDEGRRVVSGSDGRFEFTRLTMGVVTRVILEADSFEQASDAARAAFERIGEIEQAASDYRPQSELMIFCRRPVGEWSEISDDLAAMFRISRGVSERTGGAFDITIGNAVGLWRTARATHRLPEAGLLAGAVAATDWRALEISSSSPSARLTRAGVRLDLGGIAKGYAAHEAVRKLRAIGFARCLVSLAGDVAAGDAPSGAAGWRVEVRGERSEHVLGTLLLSNAVVSTSGDAEQEVEIAGKRYSHILDPRTGLGVVDGRCVTAIGTDGALVDACATAGVVVEESGLGDVVKDGRVTLIVHQMRGPAVVIGDSARVRWNAQ